MTATHHPDATAFCFSCSRAAGVFVIDDRALAGRKRELLAEAGFAAVACWGIRGADGGINHHRRPAPPATAGPAVEDRNIPVWTFEEGAKQAAVYALARIRGARGAGSRRTPRSSPVQ